MDASQQLAHERLENKIHEFRSEMAELRRRNDILHVSSNEAERRRLIAEEAASDRDAFVNYLFAALRNEAKNWSSWAKARTREEHGQMLLASTATVEKAERAAIENDESTVRADRIRAIAHPMAYFTSVRTLHSAEEGERSSIVKQWAVVSNDMVLEHSQFLTSISVDLHARFMKLKEDNIVAMTDLYAIRERLGSMEKESKEETNKVGSLLRANKVLQNALSSCRFLDIHRVRLDSTQLKEDTFRRNIEVESLAARQRVALLCARNCVISSLAGMRSRDSMRFSSPMSSPVLHPSSRFEFSSAAKNCNSALVAAASVMDQLATGFFRDDLFSHHDELDRQQAFGSGEYPVKEGWLFRADMSTWVNRFFVFENGNLMYVSPNSAARRAVVVTVDGITEVSPLVSPDEQPGGKFSSFLWEVKTISGDRVKFCSPTVVDRSEWVAVIKEAMTLHARFTGRGPAGLTEKRRRNVSSQQVSRSPHVEPRVSASPMSPVSPARRPSEHGYHTALSERARPVLRPSHQTWERPETIEPAGFFSAPSGIRIDTSLL
ncbi:hypothetical protein DIPPA_30710 [Diplonema papillatum]|nr:hypothetical protein DIPPA_30710 [Diplonema papillatum]